MILRQYRLCGPTSQRYPTQFKKLVYPRQQLRWHRIRGFDHVALAARYRSPCPTNSYVRIHLLRLRTHLQLIKELHKSLPRSIYIQTPHPHPQIQTTLSSYQYLPGIYLVPSFLPSFPFLSFLSFLCCAMLCYATGEWMNEKCAITVCSCKDVLRSWRDGRRDSTSLFMGKKKQIRKKEKKKGKRKLKNCMLFLFLFTYCSNY